MNDGVEARLARLTEMRRQAPDSTGSYADSTAKGVTVSWLSQVFELPVPVVKAKLKFCQPKTVRRRGEKMVSTYYDIKEAAAFLVTPAFSTAEYLRAVKRGELPPALQQQIWDALLKRQKWEENAGQLWRTEKVRQVLGSTFQTIKFTIQLWADTVERQTELSPDQRATIIRMADALQSEIYDSLVRQAEEGSTGSQLDEMPDHVGESAAVISTVALVESEEDEIAGLI
mgnify:CR=1 FL=1|jgi:hypothetical protein